MSIRTHLIVPIALLLAVTGCFYDRGYDPDRPTVAQLTVDFAGGSEVLMDITYRQGGGAVFSVRAETPWRSQELTVEIGEIIALRARTIGEPPALSHLNCGVRVDNGSSMSSGGVSNDGCALTIEIVRERE
jgi:hypothetical protein